VIRVSAMTMALRILHTADSHIGADLPLRANGKYRRRGSDFVASFRRVLARAQEFQVDVVILAGDLFDRSHPRAGAIAAGTEPIWQVAQTGISVIIIPGNHERSILPDALLLSHANIHVLRAPGAVVIERHGLRLAIAGFPCLRRNAAARFAEAVEETGWRQARADVNILVVHQTFAGARCGPGNFQFKAGEDVVPREAIPGGFHCIAAGHIHRYQVLPSAEPDGPPHVYAGSPDRITFAEIGEPKGCVLVDFADGRVQLRFVEHAVRLMEILPLDVTGLDGAEIAARVLAAVDAAPAEAVSQVRLSGQTTRRTLAGLQLTGRIRAVRPDLTASVSAQAVEWIADRAAFRVASQGDRSAFDVLDAPPVPVVRVGLADLGALPAACGTYALYDAQGRLLYVGKALNARTRVRLHLRGSAVSNHFHGWGRHIAQVEVRAAGSELEALLVEAELVRRLTPPFNRQMRLWKRYCYLCAGHRPYGQLEIRPEPVRGRLVFGPLRSRVRAEAALEALCGYFGLARCPDDVDENRQRLLPPSSPARLCERYFAGRCAGPCGGRIGQTEYAARLRARDALLAGADTPIAAAVRDELDHLAKDSTALASTAGADRLKVLRTIAALRETAILLRDAKALLDRTLRLTGLNGSHTLATITRHGLILKRLDAADAAASSMMAWPGGPRGRQETVRNGALPKPVADCLCMVVQQLRRRPASHSPATDPERSTVRKSLSV
jgi:exonuclease SbcD